MSEEDRHSPPARKLAAIMFTDIVGYTALMGKDAGKALNILHKNREIQRPLIEKYSGKWLKEMGDGILAQFDSAIDSVQCALEIQRKAGKELEPKIRIGIHLGDITVENEDVFGDGVNIASRLQAITDPGGIYISDSIQHAIRGNTHIRTEYFGAVELKNVDYLVNTYFLVDEGLPVPSRKKRMKLSGGTRRSILKSVYTYVIAFFIVAATIIAGLWIRNLNEQDLKAIAVLPVENLSVNTDQEWLAAGIHQALIDELSMIHAFRVISKTTSLKYQGSNKAIPEIASELNVDGILEASFYQSGEDVNIQVRLIQALPEERQIWRQEYNRGMQNILTIYNDVAKAVAEVANISLSDEEETYLSSPKQVNPKAYEAYLRGMSYWEKGTKEDLDKALDYFELSRDIDPEYALAYLGISKAWGGYAQHGFMSSGEVRAKTEDASRKALELDSTLVEIRAGMAIGYTWGTWEWEKAGKEFKRAIKINPNYAFAQAYYSHYLAIMGDPEKGLPHSELAIKLDPFNTLYQSIHGMALKNARKYDEALELMLKVDEAEPEQGIGLPVLWAVYHEKNMYEKAYETAKRIYALKGNNAAITALEEGYVEGGYKKAMQRTAEVMIAIRDTTYIAPWQICTLYTRAEMKEESLKWLETAYDEHDSNMPYIPIDPLFDFIRKEPRFINILHKMKLPEINFKK